MSGLLGAMGSEGPHLAGGGGRARERVPRGGRVARRGAQLVRRRQALQGARGRRARRLAACSPV